MLANELRIVKRASSVSSRWEVLPWPIITFARGSRVSGAFSLCRRNLNMLANELRMRSHYVGQRIENAISLCWPTNWESANKVRMCHRHVPLVPSGSGVLANKNEMCCWQIKAPVPQGSGVLHCQTTTFCLVRKKLGSDDSQFVGQQNENALPTRNAQSHYSLGRQILLSLRQSV